MRIAVSCSTFTSAFKACLDPKIESRCTPHSQPEESFLLLRKISYNMKHCSCFTLGDKSGSRASQSYWVTEPSTCAWRSNPVSQAETFWKTACCMTIKIFRWKQARMRLHITIPRSLYRSGFGWIFYVSWMTYLCFIQNGQIYWLQFSEIRFACWRMNRDECLLLHLSSKPVVTSLHILHWSNSLLPHLFSTKCALPAKIYGLKCRGVSGCSLRQNDSFNQPARSFSWYSMTPYI